MVKLVIILISVITILLLLLFFTCKNLISQKKEIEAAKNKIIDLEEKNERFNEVHKKTRENQIAYRSGDDESNFTASVKFLSEHQAGKKS